MQTDQCASHQARLRATSTNELLGALASSTETAL